ncbi:MAG: hypothetical protein IPO22_13020 [Anaerolineales bacterium]|nr:hypothetical protein [Anaerolineales bacterium]
MKSAVPSSRFSFISLLIIALLIGCFTVEAYGESWDEPDIYRYSEYSLNAYQYILHPADLPSFDTNLDFYGPAYFMLAALLARGLMTLIPAWTIVTAWHFVYFLTFLAGAIVLYKLSQRWMSDWAAFGVAVIFLTQPTLWGHAFINPKDTPFMTFFMAGIYLGFQMADAEPRSFRRAGLILAAGIVLGLTISLRVLGPLAGLFVLIYAIRKDRQHAFYFLLVYILIAGVTAYLTWPFLWGTPLANYLESLKVMSQFPFDAKVFYWGDLHEPGRIPRSYFPTMLSLQLTEPLLILFAAGLGAMVFSFRQKEKVEPILLFAGWFILPALAVILLNSTLYDNARQLYFILPPMFYVAGFGLDLIFKYITRPQLKIVLLVFAILPGLYSSMRLHPYEYAYYNSFIGGTDGAVSQMETDYWGTSFKEAMEYINRVAPQQARILILSGPDDVAKRYTRPDLQVVTEENDPTPQEKYDYVLILTRKNQGEQRCKNSETVYSVERGGAVFTFVKKLGVEGFCK